VQVDSIKPKLKPPGTKRLKLNCETLLSTSAFNFNLRRYNKASVAAVDNADIIAAAAAVSAGAKAAIPPPPTSLAEAATTAIGQGLAASTYFITRNSSGMTQVVLGTWLGVPASQSSLPRTQVFFTGDTSSCVSPEALELSHLTPQCC
jgi:hypothetical protein